MPFVGYVAILAAVTFTTFSVDSAAAENAAVTCEGQAATLIGDPSVSYLVGTAGDDVIVTAGSVNIHAEEGQDLICVTGGASTDVNAGFGDDRVISNDTARSYTEVILGPGDDTIVGGAGAETVSPGPGADLVLLGAGRDGVISQPVRGSNESQGDSIELGRGNDFASGPFELMTTPLDGGEGINHLILGDGYDSGTETMRVDNRSETVTADGSRLFSWNGFTRFKFEVSARVHFTGSMADESVVVYHWEGRGPRLGGRWDLGGGSDNVNFTNFAGHVRGDAGEDRLSVDRFVLDDVPFDPLGMRARLGLGQGQLRFDEVQEVFSVSGIENGSLEGFRYAFLRGDERANELHVAPDCRAWVFGGKGDDLMTSKNARNCASPLPAPRSFRGMRAYGGPGDDTLTGGRAPDTLVGDQGKDRVDGRRGKDACAAEVVLHCERKAP